MSTGMLLKQIVDKYELSEPIPQAVRLAMNKSRKKNLIKILKQEEPGALFISASVGLFLLVKKIGVPLSLAKCAAAVMTAAAIGAGAVFATSAYTVKIIIEKKSDKAPVIEKIQEIKKTDTARRSVLSYSFAVSRIAMDGVSNDKTVTLTNEMIRELRKQNGEFAAIGTGGLDKYHVSEKIVNVSVIRLNESLREASEKNFMYRVSAKVVNSRNSQLLLHVSENAESEENISDSLKRLVKKIR